MSTTSLYNYLEGYGLSMNDRQYNWLKEQLPGTPFESLNDLWYMYLLNQGFTGTQQEMFMSWLVSMGLDSNDLPNNTVVSLGHIVVSDGQIVVSN